MYFFVLTTEHSNESFIGGHLYRCSVCLSNSKQLFHNQTVLMTSHYLDFDAVTHSIKDVSVSTRQNRLLLPNCSGFMGKSRINRYQNVKPNFAQVTEQSEFT